MSKKYFECSAGTEQAHPPARLWASCGCVGICGFHQFSGVKPLVLFSFYHIAVPETGSGYGKDKNHQKNTFNCFHIIIFLNYAAKVAIIMHTIQIK
jgi:hypothetical protein